MNSTFHSVMLIAVISFITIIIRFLPFAIFRDDKKIPKALLYLGDVLPGAIMGMLIVYCFKSIKITIWPFGLPELIASIVVISSYLWKRNTLISIGIGTILYMIMVQTLFI